MVVKVHGFDEAIEHLQKLQYGLTEEGLNEYLSNVKRNANEICGLSEEEIVLKAEKKGEKLSINFNLKDGRKLECVKNAIEKILPILPITTKSLFEQLIILIKEKIEETETN